MEEFSAVELAALFYLNGGEYLGGSGENHLREIGIEVEPKEWELLSLLDDCLITLGVKTNKIRGGKLRKEEARDFARLAST